MGGFDVVIVGAGPAGSAAAIRLSRAGGRVLLLEKARFPRHKVCGGCVSAAARRELRELLGAGAPLPGRAARRICFTIGRQRVECAPRGDSWLVERSELDQRLAEEAARAGARICFETAGSVAVEDGRWVVRAEGERIRANWIVIASGLPGLARKLAPRTRQPAAPMIGQQWTQRCAPGLPRPGEVEMHWLRGGYVGLAGLGGGDCVIALAVQTKRMVAEQPLHCLRRLNRNSALLERLPVDPRPEFGAVGTATFPWRPTRIADRNLLLAGDAAGFEQPFTGEGIGQALRSGRLAAEAILTGADAATAYGRLMRKGHRPVLRRTSLLGAVLKSRWVELAARVPRLPTGMFAPLIGGIHAGELFRKYPVQLQT